MRLVNPGRASMGWGSPMPIPRGDLSRCRCLNWQYAGAFTEGPADQHGLGSVALGGFPQATDVP